MEDITFQKNCSALIRPDYGAAAASRQTDGFKTVPGGKSFSGLFQEKIREASGQVTFSKHALQRMEERNIPVSAGLVSRMSNAVAKAKDKGVREALMLSGSTAFIVNIPSGTVVTTMNGGEMKDNIFTNIDGAVIL